MDGFKTLKDAIIHFADFENCKAVMMKLRWPNGVVKCPYCGSEKVTYLAKNRVWKCYTGHDKPKFSLKTGTVFEDSPLGLDKWLPALWLVVNCKSGISSCELARDLGVTQKTAWFMAHRIRLAMQDGSIEKFSGRVEADETYIGGAARFMHKNRKTGKRGMIGKTAVLGLLAREAGNKPSRVRCKIVKRTRVSDLDSGVRANVEKGSELITDKLSSYYKLADEYAHK